MAELRTKQSNNKVKLYTKILFFVLFIIILLTAFYIIKPFLAAVIAGATIAYLSYPLYKKIQNRIPNKNIASLIVTVFIALLITLPFIILLGLISKEAYVAYTKLSQQKLGTNFLDIVCMNENSFFCRSVKSFIALLPEASLDYYLQATIKKITDFVIKNVSEFLVSIPSIILYFFVMMFVIYYLLKDGESIANRIKSILPLKESHKHKVIEKFHNVAYAVFYGNLSIAILQGILGSIGFLIFGVPSPLLWGFVMIPFALIPYFGTAIIWFPAALNLIFNGMLQNDNSFIIRGILLILYSLLIISSIDNLLKPKLIGTKAKVHPVLILLGVLGGLNLFGFIGLILGPVILALLMTFVSIYEEEF